MQRNCLQHIGSGCRQQDATISRHAYRTGAQWVDDNRDVGNDGQTLHRRRELGPRLRSRPAQPWHLHRAARRQRSLAEPQLQEPGGVVAARPQQRAQPSGRLGALGAGGVLAATLVGFHPQRLADPRCDDLEILAELPHQLLEVLLATSTLLDVVAQHHHRRHHHKDQGVGAVGERKHADPQERREHHGQPRHPRRLGALGQAGEVMLEAFEQRRDARRPREGHRGAVTAGRARSVLEQAHLDLGVADADAITRFEDRPRHLGPADRDPIGRAEVHDLHGRDRCDLQETGDQQLGVTT